MRLFESLASCLGEFKILFLKTLVNILYIFNKILSYTKIDESDHDGGSDLKTIITKKVERNSEIIFEKDTVSNCYPYSLRYVKV